MKKVKIDVNSKQFKYYQAKKTGKTKKESALIAGYTPAVAESPNIIEVSQKYQAIEKHFKDELLAKITLSEVADALIDNIKQQTDRSSRNRAIEIALNRIEPDKIANDDEHVVIVLKQ